MSLLIIYVLTNFKDLTDAVTVLDPNGWYIISQPEDLSGCVSALHGIPVPSNVIPYAFDLFATSLKPCAACCIHL